MRTVTRGARVTLRVGVWGRRCCRQQLVAEPAGEPVAKPTHLPEQADAHTREGKALV